MSLKKIVNTAFPKEHGSWGLAYEPLLLSTIIAYSLSGLMTALAAFVIFLSHQPVRILLNKNLIGEIKRHALIPLAFYTVVIIGLLYVAFSNGEIENFIPFFSAIALMLTFLAIEILGFGRNLAAEFIPPIAMGLIAITITLLGGFTLSSAFGVMILIYSRSFTTIFYVHEKLLLQKGNKISKIQTRLSELIFFVILLFIANDSIIPFASILAPIILFIRAEIGLAKFRKSDTVKKVGISEFIYGIVFIAIVSISYFLK
jgi:hypothetical protein